MTEPFPVTIPLINPNEPEALLASLHVKEGQWAAQGDPLCTLETTKSTAEVTAERPGYVAGLRAQPGQTLQAGELLCYLAPSPDWQPPASVMLQAGALTAQAGEEVGLSIPSGMRLTQPALALAQKHHLDLKRLPVEALDFGIKAIYAALQRMPEK